MAALPIRDPAGNALLGIRFVAEEELAELGRRVAMPAALVVVRFGGAVLLMFDGRRRQWELPGGMREPGETARQAAVRELREETGIDVTGLAFVLVAEVELTKPRRRGLLAVFQVRPRTVPRLIVNDEALDFRWWPPSEAVAENMSPLDAEIARRVVRSPAT